MKTRSLILIIVCLLLVVPLIFAYPYIVKSINIVIEDNTKYYQNYADVLLVCNPSSAIGTEVCNYFIDERTPYQFNPENVINLVNVTTTETITDTEYNKIFTQVSGWLNNSEQEINYIVTTKGVPLRTGSGQNCGMPYWSWSSCKVTSCNLGYESNGTACIQTNCVGDSQQLCEINGDGWVQGYRYRTCNSTTGNWSDWGNCIGFSCYNYKGYEIINNSCTYTNCNDAGSSTKSCNITNGGGTQFGHCIDTGWSLGKCKSVDSKLMIDLGLNATIPLGKTALKNPYYGNKSIFSHEIHGGYLVTRLDGVTAKDIKQLIDSSTIAQENGLDGKYLINCYGSNGDYYGWCNAAKNTLLAQNKTVEYNTTAFVKNEANLSGYVSYGSNACGTYCANSSNWNFSFNPGALTETFVSTSGRTFNSYWSGSGQSLVTDMLRYNATGVKGYTYEPYLAACANVNYLWDRYLKGYNLADSYYIASRYSNWMDVVIGDPKTYIVVNRSLEI